MTYHYIPDGNSDRLYAVYAADIDSLAPLKTWCETMKIKTVGLPDHVLETAYEIEIIRHLTPGFYFSGRRDKGPVSRWLIDGPAAMKGFMWFPRGKTGDVLITEFMLRGERYE